MPGVLIRYWKGVSGFFFLTPVLLIFIVFIYSFYLPEPSTGPGTSPAVHPHTRKEDSEINQLRRSLKSIDSCILRIDRFMKLRNIEGFSPKPTGWGEGRERKDLQSLVTEYNQLIIELDQRLESLPIGFPHPGPRSSGFGHRENPFGKGNIEGHKGIDFKGAMGSPVRTTAKGDVIFAGVKGGYGNCVVIRHGKEFQTLYGHLSSINVKKGEDVEPGSIIGKIGSTGRSTGPHLHYEIIRNGTKIDPETYLNL
ncbi:M23 family metallopeptidase [Chryseobacterium gossypii]|uniref:M23 family metallopeptidase n=1 Tax=Chryseobacterium gossypii TaxID=3231602 RepID=UPI003525DD17